MPDRLERVREVAAEIKRLHDAQRRPRKTPGRRRAIAWRQVVVRMLLARQYRVCPICRHLIMPRDDVEVDHIVPVSRGGDPDDPENLQATHLACNRAKGTRTLPV